MAGPYWGRVKALINDHGIKVRTALPSMPVKCMGLSGVPPAGAAFQVYTSDRVARDLAERRNDDLQAARMVVPKKASLDTMVEQLKQNQRLELKLILKCDTQGSLEAIQKVLGEIKSDKISIAIVMDGVGNINENDVLLASASDAIVIGFNVSKEERVARAQKAEGVEIRLYSIIYQIADEIREAMSGMLAPELRDKLIGRAEVRQVFPISKTGNVAGCLMVHGRVHSRCKTRVKRAGDLLYEGAIQTLKRFQDEVNEVREGQECGIRLNNFADVAVADILEFFEVEKIPQKL
jgi:translation initiation factor IF-2